MVWILGGSHTMACGSTKTWLSGDDCSSSECAQMAIQRGPCLVCVVVAGGFRSLGWI